MEKFKKIAIFLDDERQVDFINPKLNTKKYQWVIIRNYFDFVDYVDKNLEKISLISFDHDIDSFDDAGTEWTGRDAAKYLQKKCQDNNLNFPDFMVHSMNNIGKQNILNDIKHYISKFEQRGVWDKWRYYHVGFVDGEFI